jgi:putative glutathione S-transferase
MDCLCCVDGGAGPKTNDEFLGSVCRLIEQDGTPAKFPAEPNRYFMYVIAGCPFAARPWAVQALYGLPIPIVKLFPASDSNGWFFEPQTDGEKDLVSSFPTAAIDRDPLYQANHLRELYEKANPDFNGAISVPLLWDKVQDTAVSNSSLGLAEMMATQMKGMATRNREIELFPAEQPERQQHSDLVKSIHCRITTAVYKINATKDGKQRDEMVHDYYAALREFQEILSKQEYLMGDQFRFADIVLWISLIRLDLAYQWRFGLGRYSVREDYPGLFAYVQRIMKLEGMKETVFPRDIMALYFMTTKWNQNGSGRALPMVPNAWECSCFNHG